MRGGSLQALKETLGHATLAMTMRYAHLAPEHIRSEITKTERPVEPGSGTSGAQNLVNIEESETNCESASLACSCLSGCFSKPPYVV
jgi:hypothetical protein